MAPFRFPFGIILRLSATELDPTKNIQWYFNYEWNLTEAKWVVLVVEKQPVKVLQSLK